MENQGLFYSWPLPTMNHVKFKPRIRRSLIHFCFDRLSISCIFQLLPNSSSLCSPACMTQLPVTLGTISHHFALPLIMFQEENSVITPNYYKITLTCCLVIFLSLYLTGVKLPSQTIPKTGISNILPQIPEEWSLRCTQ